MLAKRLGIHVFFIVKQIQLSLNGRLLAACKEADNKVTVVLDIRLDDALLEEGFVRELISKIQTMRKEAGFEVVDHIVLSQSGNDRISDIIKKNEAVIKNDTLADEIIYNNVEGYTKDWNLNGEHTSLGVSKKG